MKTIDMDTGFYRDGRRKKPRAYHYRQHVVKTKSGCWHWSGCHRSNGVPYFGQIKAQRYAFWMAQHGDKPYALPNSVIKSTCGFEHCINPAHLSEVPRTIIHTGVPQRLRNGGLTCKNGHDLSARTKDKVLDAKIRDRGCPFCIAERQHAIRVAKRLEQRKTPVTKQITVSIDNAA